MNTGQLLSCRELRVGYRDKAVAGPIDLDLADGQVLLVVGRNGVGKTTTLLTWFGILPPVSGQVLVGGHLPRLGHNDMCFVGDTPALYPELTVGDHFELLARLWAGRRELTDFAELDGYLGLTPLLDTTCRVLSKGQQQRVWIALSVLARPRLILMDEPFTGLDFEGVEGARELISQSAAQGASVVVASHIIDPLAGIGDSALLLGTDGEPELLTDRKEDLITGVRAWYEQQ